METPQTADTNDVRKKFNLPADAIPIVITFLTPGDNPDEFKVGIFINEQQPVQLIKNTLGAVNDIIDQKQPNINGQIGGPQQMPQQRIPTLKDLVED